MKHIALLDYIALIHSTVHVRWPNIFQNEKEGISNQIKAASIATGTAVPKHIFLHSI